VDQVNGGSQQAAEGAERTSTPLPPGPLLAFARLLDRELRLRAERFPLIDEARWLILLDIYLAAGAARDTPFMSAAHASSAPLSTAQRHLHEMIAAGLISQHRWGPDQRITHVCLTDRGLALVNDALSRTMALRAKG
jgi:DNA-binding MarR family transcriptional regulator